MISGANILVVDDNPDIIESLTDFLRLNGCNVFSAFTGKACIDLLRKNKEIEVVILDVGLPDVNGIALLDMIKVENPTVSVVIVTGNQSTDSIVEAIKKGASDFIIKPVEFEKLIFTLIRALKERSLLIEKEHYFQRLEDKKKIELLNRELQKKIKELTTMYHISNQFNSINIFTDVYDRMVQIVKDVLEVTSCGYYIFDNNKGEMILYSEKSNGHISVMDKTITVDKRFLKLLESGKKYALRKNRLFVPITIKGECIGFIAVDTKKKGVGSPVSNEEEDIFLLKLIAEKASTHIENRILYESLFESVFKTLTSLMKAINKRDAYTENHCWRVTEMAVELGERLGLKDNEIGAIKVAGPIHDLGKIGIPDSILLKPDRLTDEEYHIMKTHPTMGEEILNRFDILSNEASIIRHHHERFDGSGYPNALKGEEIPVSSRIISICDTFDAMTTTRPYRKAVDKSYALEEIRRCKNRQFDPVIADCFIEMMQEKGVGNGG
ncbi:MAG: response regulator [Syntrophorhabdaceae bacterium]|nr:response regulator [Syntrophorhabdaceae bacterium]